MLKFSGFADLTSCLEKETAPAARGRGKFQRQRTTTEKKHEALFKLLAAKVPMHYMRRGRPRARPDAQTLLTRLARNKCKLEPW